MHFEVQGLGNRSQFFKRYIWKVLKIVHYKENIINSIDYLKELK